MLSNFTNIKAAIEDWLNREGFTDVTDNTEDFMILGQRRYMRQVRVPGIEAVTTTSVSTVSFAVPTDYLELKSAFIIGNRNTQLGRSDYAEVRQQVTPGRPDNIATAGSNFFLGPPPDTAYDIELVYYTKVALIDSTNATNWFSLNAPELILAASMVEAYLFLKDNENLGIWEHKYNSTMKNLAIEKNSSEHSGSGLQVKPHNNVTP